MNGTLHTAFTAVALVICVSFFVPSHAQIDSYPRQLQQIKRDLRSIETALNLFRLDNFRYPTTEEGLQVLAEPSGRRGKAYLLQVPIDPWSHPYRYAIPGLSGEFDLYTLGADNREGGEGANSDFSSRDIN